MKNKCINRREFLKSTAAGISFLSLGLSLNSCSPYKKKPNIIFICTDDQRWDAMGCAGNPIIQTPNMDKLANQGIRFEKTFVTTPICAASRASIFTGMYERKHSYTFTKPPIRKEHTDVSYPKMLKDAGYRTGFVGKFGVEVPEGTIEEWFDYYRPTGYPYFKEDDGKQKHLTDINMDLAIDFIRKTSPDQPFCLSLSTWAPHAHDSKDQQYFWPSACDGHYENVTIPPPKLSEPAFFDSLPEFVKISMNRERWYWRFDTPEKYQQMVKGYYRMISGVDMALGRLMDELSKMELDKNTVIIFMSDNGYFLGERGFAGKWSMHDLSIRVPLIIYNPRNPQKLRGNIDQNMVLNIDIAPTILELAGLPVPEDIQGNSLGPLLRGDIETWRNEILTEHLWDHPDIPLTEGVRTERWKYIRYPQHAEFEELYDLQNDHIEKNNLVSSPQFIDTLKTLRKRCDKLIHDFSDFNTVRGAGKAPR